MFAALSSKKNQADDENFAKIPECQLSDLLYIESP